MRTRRDLTIVPLEAQNIVIACDSCGAVGNKSGDVFKLPPRYVGKFATRVSLTEVLCSGATPVTITNGVACEMQPTGAEIILGIQEELQNAGITDILLTGSTEENFTTSMTALAVTVIGVAKDSELKFETAAPGDKLVLLGNPKVGAEVDLESAGFYPVIKQLLPLSGVKEIVPVGSKGVAYEAETLAKLSGATFVLYETNIDYYKSAGPATCLLVLCESIGDVLITCKDATVVGEISDSVASRRKCSEDSLLAERRGLGQSPILKERR